MIKRSTIGVNLMILIVFIVFGTMLFGCGEKNKTKDIIGDKLYVPEGYERILEAKHLTEIAALPYFTSPFMTIAKNEKGDQFAVVFRDSGQTEEVKLPVTYEDIVRTVESKGFKINSSSSSLQNLHLFEINKKLVWNYEDGSGKIYLDLEGREVNPF